jgi:predicted dehydrogenase
MRTLIAGLGSIGRRHLRNLQALGESDIILLRSGRSTLPEAELAGLPAVDSIERGLSLRPQAVIIANPTAHHLDVAIPAAEAGCHLLLEKPVSHSMQGVADLARIAAASGSRILVGFQFRFHPCLQLLQRLLSDGELGEPLHAGAHWGEYLPDWHPWEDHRSSYSARADLGGGVVLTLSHPLDYLNWLFGQPVGVVARTAQLPHLELQGVEGMADIVLQYSSGMSAGVHLNYAQRPAVHRLEIVGTEGSATCDLLAGQLRWWTRSSGRWLEQLVPPGFERNDLFLDELRHFRDLVQLGAEPACRLEEGVASLKVALAAIEAGRRSAPLSFEANEQLGALTQLPRREVGDG